MVMDDLSTKDAEFSIVMFNDQVAYCIKTH